MNLSNIEKTILAGKTLTQEQKDYIVKYANAIWDEHPDVAFRFPRWKKVLAWVAGYQYYDYNKATKTLMPVQLKRKRKLVFNRLRPFARTMLAKLTQTKAALGVVPNTDEYEDIAAAEAGDKVLDFLSEKLRFPSLRRAFAAWFVLCNRAFIRVFWNGDGQGLLARQNEPIVDDVGQQVGERLAEITESGEVGMEVLSPFNCRVDPLNFERDRWRWFMYGEEVEAEVLEEEYGLEEGTINEKSETQENMYQLDNSGDEDFQFGQSATEEKVTGKLVVEKHFWTPRINLTIAGDQVLDAIENKYNEIPVFTYEDRLVPINHYEKGVVYNDGLLKDLIPVQREYNRTKSIESQAISRAAQLKVLGPFDSAANKEHFLDQSGISFIDVNAQAGGFQQLRLDPLPPWAFERSQGLEREFESVGNMHEASFGRLPERASHASGALVNVLLEQDDQVLDPLVTDMDAVFGQAWSLALRIVQERYTTSRLIKVVGRNSYEGAMKFRGSDLKGNTDVKVSSNTGLPRSRALRVEYIKNLWDSKLLTDQKMALETMEFGEAKKIFSDTLLHEKRAARENSMIETTPAITTDQAKAMLYPLDDNLAHLKMHLRDRLSPKFDAYTDSQKQTLELHIQAHQMALMPPAPPAKPTPAGTQPPATNPQEPQAPAPQAPPQA